MNERGTRVSQVYSQNNNGSAASVADVAAYSSSNERSSPRRIKPAHFGCVDDDLYPCMMRHATHVGVFEPRADDRAGTHVGIADGDGWSNMSH